MTKPLNGTPGWLVVGLGSMLILSPVQDSFLQATPLNMAGASPTFLIVLVIWLIFCTNSLVLGHWLRPVPVWLLAYGMVFLLLNILYSASFGFEVYGENLLIKGCKIGILLGALAFVAWLYSSYTLPRFSLIVRIAYGVALGGMVLDMVFHDFWIHNTWIHGGIILNPKFDFGMVDNRPHGFASESSTLAITLATLGLLCASTTRSIRARWLWVMITFASLLPVSSKAGPLLMLFSLVLAVFLVRVRSGSIRQIFMIVSAGLFVVVLGLPFWQKILEFYVFDSFLHDAEAGTSVATRLTLWIGALITVVKYPWGVGLSGYLPAVVQSIDQAGSYAEMLFGIPLNLSEVVGYTTQISAYAIGTKSLFLDCLIVFGIPFGIYWILVHIRLAKRLMRCGEVVPLSLLIMLACALMTYIPGVGIYPIAIAYGWLFRTVTGEYLVLGSKSTP